MFTDPVESARFYLLGLATLHLRQRIPDDEIAWVLKRSPPVHYSAGQVVFQQGEPADAALLVVRGELVALVAGPEGERVVGTIGAWDVIGETALYAPDKPRSATVRASRDSTCLLVGHGMLLEARHNGVVAAIEYHLLHTLTQRIRRTNQAIQDAWRDLEDAASPRGTEPGALRLLDLLGSRA